MDKHITVGLGEVGTAIRQIFNTDGYDKNQAKETLDEQYDVLHVCIPYSDDFVTIVKGFQELWKPKFTIIHSSVPVGTSRQCNALHSPIRGLHPNLYGGIMTFPKFIGGEQASLVADMFRRAGLKVILCDKQETTELGKLLDTEYYRECVEFTLKAKRLADKLGVPFHESYTLFNQTYNEGYTKLNHPEYIRPVLQPIMKEIGGHCLLPNQKLLEKTNVV